MKKERRECEQRKGKRGAEKRSEGGSKEGVKDLG